MLCDICQHEAVGKCLSCGIAFCSNHGNRCCFRCSAAVVAAEPSRRSPTTAIRSTELPPPSVSGKGYLQCETTARPTIYLDDPEPPGCYICQGLARHICRNCHNLYCPEHAAGSELCASCARSSLWGLIILGVMFWGFVLVLLFGLAYGSAP